MPVGDDAQLRWPTILAIACFRDRFLRATGAVNRWAVTVAAKQRVAAGGRGLAVAMTARRWSTEGGHGRHRVVAGGDLRRREVWWQR